VVAGQAVVEVIDPASVWINVRFDQSAHAGLREPAVRAASCRAAWPGSPRRAGGAGGAAGRRGDRGDPGQGGVRYLAEPLPPIGELAEVTVALAALPARPVVGNASVQR
jgi:HlyD family secretion protein